jgi:IMP dehydrogenase/GMP reductase
MSYTGSTTIEEFKDNAQFVQVSTASVSENGAHEF